MLGRLAELYECSVGDLVLDHADFRHRDVAHGARGELNRVREVLEEVATYRTDHGTGPDLETLMERLDEMDVHEFGRLSATLAQQVDMTNIDRRALLLKLAAGLSLAAVAPTISTLEADAEEAAPPSAGDRHLTGVWRSRYIYYSSGRQSELIGEHYVVLNQQENHISGQSLPNSLGRF